jgi:exo-1,4-beta-D-glucosaminidase
VLTLSDPAGKTISSNLYWLSTAKETLAWDKTKWFVTPTRSFADFTALDSLPKVHLNQAFNTVREGDELRTTVTLENPTKNIAFLVRLKANKGKDGEEILPVFWEDNYISLLPGEKRVISARYAAADVGNATPHVTVQGWNVETD